MLILEAPGGERFDGVVHHPKLTALATTYGELLVKQRDCLRRVHTLVIHLAQDDHLFGPFVSRICINACSARVLECVWVLS